MYAFYGIYLRTRNATWQCLIDFKISALPVNVIRIANEAGIKVVNNSTVRVLDTDDTASCYAKNGKWYIVIDDNRSDEE